MNTGSPLSKDQRVAKPTNPVVVKKKISIGAGTAKKLLKDSGAVIGAGEVSWLNRYMENKVAGESLPKSFLTNDLYAEICRTYGKDSKHYIAKIVSDFKRENGIAETIKEEPEHATDTETETEV